MKSLETQPLFSEQTTLFECKFCPGRFSCQNLYDLHCKKEHKLLQCTLCERKISQTQYKLHLKAHTRVKQTFTCEFCGGTFHNLGNLRRHMRMPNYKCNADVFKCILCDMTLFTDEELRRHFLLNHLYVKELCVCGEVCGELCVEERHYLEKLTPYECKECENKFSFIIQLEKHSLGVHNIKMQKSLKLKRDAWNSMEPQKRIKYANNAYYNQTAECEDCGKTMTRSNLSKHKKIHTGEKRYLCEYCCKAFTHPTALRVHLRSHTGERPYKCETCKRAFYEPKGLKNHKCKHHSMILQ